MTLLEKFKKITRKEPEIRNFCIQVLRFKKFLENARALLDLFADGREKAEEDYIFDRHYVVSLIDGVVERLGMMVYDACVLAPNRGEDLYAGYDRMKVAAKNLMAAGGKTTASTGPGAEPEYQLLSAALQWFNGKGVQSTETVMGFIKQMFSHVLQGAGLPETDKKRAMLENSGLQVMDKGLYAVDIWRDSLGLPEKPRTTGDFSNTPLRHLLMAAGDGNTGGRADWVAAVSEYQLSLDSLKPGTPFRLETLASGQEHSDFIFVSAGKTVNLDGVLPSGFHIEATDEGFLAWNLDVSTKTIEDSLMIIGRGLFG